MSWRVVPVWALFAVILGGCSTPPERYAHLPQARPTLVPRGADVAEPGIPMEIRAVPPEETPPKVAVDVDRAAPPKPAVPSTAPGVLSEGTRPDGVVVPPEGGVPGVGAVQVMGGDWVDLGAWLQERGWSSFHPVPHGKEVRHESDGPGGTVALMPGQKKTWWNGTQVWFGFEPILDKGRIKIHRRDLESHCLPLISGSVVADVTVRSVVIDAGHGGRNVGTRSVAGNRLEKEFTLDWALRLAGLLEKRGWKVTLTRTNDVDVTLAERVDLAEASDAKLFVSLHFNSAFPNREAAGLETYSVTPKGMASHVVRDYPDEPTRTFPNNAHDPANLRIALAVHRAVLGITGQVDRGVRRARFMDVLRWQNRPAILIEGGYLSSPQEAARIQSPEFRQKLAEAVASALP